jgi:two-component system KDP operon response regulator KdpE
MAPKPVALIVDDEQAIRKLLRTSLSESHNVIEALSGEEGLRLAATNNPDVILLDLGLPDLDGIEVIKRLRVFCSAPIIVLSAREQDGDKVIALDAGANDYLTKPFSVAELQARMRVALRAGSPAKEIPTIEFADVRVDLVRREVFRSGNPVHLTPIEFNLLVLLLRHSDRVLTHRQILTEVWGAAYARQTQYLRVFMRNLRHKLEEDPAQPKFFMTETGIGYRFRSGA